MLIQITNNCTQNCEHCFQDSRQESCGITHMTKKVFLKSVEFATKRLNAGVLIISGGEPTLHPEWYDFLKYLNFTIKVPFTLVTNGTWILNEEVCNKIIRLQNFEFCLGVQVTTVKKYYSSYQLILDNKDKFKSLGDKIYLEIDNPIYMEDIGRARTSEKAQKDVESNPYHMSCLNACLAFKQTKSLKQIGPMLIQHKQFCKPAIDWQGNIHLSESWLCPSIGSVFDSPESIFQRGKQFKPCLQCKNSKKFMDSTRPDIILARNIIFNN